MTDHTDSASFHHALGGLVVDDDRLATPTIASSSRAAKFFEPPTAIVTACLGCSKGNAPIAARIRREIGCDASP